MLKGNNQQELMSLLCGFIPEVWVCSYIFTTFQFQRITRAAEELPSAHKSGFRNFISSSDSIAKTKITPQGLRTLYVSIEGLNVE
jgi:hypothetical protein